MVPLASMSLRITVSLAVRSGQVIEVEAAKLHVVGNVVATFRHALADAVAGDVEIRNPEKIELDEIPGGSHFAQQRGVGAARQCGFKREIFAAIGELAQTLEHDAAGFEGGAVRRERREAGGDEIGVYEFPAAHFLREEIADVGRFAGTVGAGDDEEVRHGRRGGTSPRVSHSLKELLFSPRARRSHGASQSKAGCRAL